MKKNLVPVVLIIGLIAGLVFYHWGYSSNKISTYLQSPQEEVPNSQNTEPSAEGLVQTTQDVEERSNTGVNSVSMLPETIDGIITKSLSGSSIEVEAYLSGGARETIIMSTTGCNIDIKIKKLFRFSGVKLGADQTYSCVQAREFSFSGSDQ